MRELCGAGCRAGKPATRVKNDAERAGKAPPLWRENPHEIKGFASNECGTSIPSRRREGAAHRGPPGEALKNSERKIERLLKSYSQGFLASPPLGGRLGIAFQSGKKK